jgi:cation-transporting P-type ATPase C
VLRSQTSERPSLVIPQFKVLHDVPGRCRLRIADLNTNHLVREDIEGRLKSNHLVNHFRINQACGSVTIEYKGLIGSIFSSLLRVRNVEPIKSLQPPAIKLTVPATGQDQPLRSLALSGAAFILGPVVGPVISMGFILLSGLPIWRRAILTLVHERRLNVDFLDGLALTIAVLRKQSKTAALMTFMVHLGDVVREKTARQSRGQIRNLLELHTVQARLLGANGIVTMVAAEALKPNQLVLILAGDLVPADSEITEGIAAVDQRHITGESIPATRRPGDVVFAGSSIVEGFIKISVTEAGADTVASKIVALVEAAPVGETRIQNYAEQFADHLVAPILGANVAMLALTGNVDRFMSLAIVDYGTGIRVAAPTSILASMTRAAREGILIKSGHHVESLATLRGIAFDKTGTLTCGRLAVIDVKAFDISLSADKVLQLAAAAEMELRHPVARALVWHARNMRGLELPICEKVEFVIGLGVIAEIAGHHIHIGSERFLRQLGIATSGAHTYLANLERLGHIGLLIALDGDLVGAIACSDEPRPEARHILNGLRARGVNDIVMLSGDREGVARRVAQSVGITKVYSEILPHEKADIIRELRTANGPFAMVGDGVNDSPALAQADVGISLVDGADIARTAADVVLMKEGLHLLLPAIDISRDALKLVKQNFSLIAGANTLALALAIPNGLISPAACTLLSNGSALLATLNAMRPLLPNLMRSAEYPYI